MWAYLSFFQLGYWCKLTEWLRGMSRDCFVIFQKKSNAWYVKKKAAVKCTAVWTNLLALIGFLWVYLLSHHQAAIYYCWQRNTNTRKSLVIWETRQVYLKNVTFKTFFSVEENLSKLTSAIKATNAFSSSATRCPSCSRGWDLCACTDISCVCLCI